MSRHSPLVLIAGVPHERHHVESTLEARGFATRTVDAVEDAAKELAANGAACVLVIDSGMLEAPHDPQWRLFRTQHPRLPAVVRCLMSPARRSRLQNGRTRFVDPDDTAGMEHAVRVLARE